MVKRLRATGVCAVVLLGAAGCGAAAAGGAGARPAAAPTPCALTSGPPAATRLETATEYSDGQIRLTVVDPGVQPKVGGGAAYAQLIQHQPNIYQAGTCGLTEVLAYWSSDTPAKMPAGCVPDATGNSPWAEPSNCAGTPLYTHVLAWVFVWHANCLPLGTVAVTTGPPKPAPTFAPFACTGITFVDATTGRASDYVTEGA